MSKTDEVSESPLSLMIIGWFPFPFGNASSSRIRTLSKGLLESGAKVHVVTTSRNPFREEDMQNDGSMQWEGISYETVNVYERGGGALSFSQRILNHFNALRTLPGKVEELIRRGSFDGLYLYLRGASAIVPLLGVAKKAKISVFTDQVEWFPASAFSLGIFDPRYYDECIGRNQLLRHCKAATAITSFIQEKFESMNKPCMLLPSVYDFSRAIQAPVGQKRNSNQFSILYAGTCKVGDGFTDVLKAIELCVAGGCPAQLKVLGTDGLSGRALAMRRIIEANPQIAGRVEFLGRVSDEDYPKLLTSPDCLLLPRPDTQTVRAAFPTRLPEFLATGLPVVTTSVPDVPRYLEAGVHAEIVAPTVEGLASGILRLWKDPEYADELGARAKVQAMKVFDFKIHAQNLLDFFEEYK